MRRPHYPEPNHRHRASSGRRRLHRGVCSTNKADAAENGGSSDKVARD